MSSTEALGSAINRLSLQTSASDEDVSYIRQAIDFSLPLGVDTAGRDYALRLWNESDVIQPYERFFALAVGSQVDGRHSFLEPTVHFYLGRLFLDIGPSVTDPTGFIVTKCLQTHRLWFMPDWIEDNVIR